MLVETAKDIIKRNLPKGTVHQSWTPEIYYVFFGTSNKPKRIGLQVTIEPYKDSDIVKNVMFEPCDLFLQNMPLDTIIKFKTEGKVEVDLLDMFTYEVQAVNDVLIEYNNRIKKIDKKVAEINELFDTCWVPFDRVSRDRIVNRVLKLD